MGRNIQKFPLQKYPSLGEQTRSAQGKFSQQSPDDVFVPARKKSKDSMKRQNLGFLKGKPRFPLPGEQKCSSELCCCLRGFFVFYITPGLSLPCENNPVTPKNLLSRVIVRRIWIWERDFLGWELLVNYSRQQQSFPSTASPNTFIVSTSKLLWIHFQSGNAASCGKKKKKI